MTPPLREDNDADSELPALLRTAYDTGRELDQVSSLLLGDQEHVFLV